MLTFGGQTFKNKTALKAHISKAINYKGRVIGRPFYDAVLADLFTRCHPRLQGHHPEYFLYVLNEVGDGRTSKDSLAAHIPGKGIRRFSTHTLLNPSKTLKDRFPVCCREHFARVWRQRLFMPGRCAHPGCLAEATDVDHIAPQHKEIVDTCWRLVTESDKKVWWKQLMEGDGYVHFQIPTGHPAMVEYDRLTETGTYQMLCRHHHARLSGKRSRKDPDVVPVDETFSDPGIDALFV